MRRSALLIALVVVPLTLHSPAPRAESNPGESILREAFQRRYETETFQRLRIQVRGASGAIEEQTLEIASKLYDDRLYVLGRYTEPPRMRDTAFLAIEGKENSDYFVYLPAFGKVRRVSTYQRSDPWFGTDLSFEDVERHYPSDYKILGSDLRTLEGEGSESVHVVHASPKYSSAFSEVRFFIAQKDFAILRIEYLRKGRELPSKVIMAPREHILHKGGALLPTRIVALNTDRESETIVEAEAVLFDPALQLRFFSSSRLARNASLPFVLESVDDLRDRDGSPPRGSSGGSQSDD